MRLVVLTAAYPSPADPERAVAIENLTLALVQGSACEATARRVEASVVAPRVRRADPPREVRRGIPVRRFTYPSRGLRLKEMARPSALVLGAYAVSGFAATSGEVCRRAADLILAHWLLPAGPIAAAAAAAHGIPFAVVAHGSDVNRYARTGFLREAARATLARASRVLAVSEASRRVLIDELRAPPRKVSLLPMGVDSRHFFLNHSGGVGREERKLALGADPGTPLLLFAGDLVPEKGIHELLEASRILGERGVKACVYLAGDGPLQGEIQGAPTSGRERFLGRLPQEVLAAWYRAADVFVLPSWSEGSPVAVMEALASGLPVVATRTGGIPELLDDGVTGWLVPPRNEEALAATLEGLIRNPQVLESARRVLEDEPRDFSVKARARDLSRVLEEAAHG